MRYDKTEDPDSLPVTLDEAKAACSVDGTDLDTWITALIGEAVDAIEKRLSVQIMEATWTATYDGFPDVIRLEKVPVTAVSSITYLDTAGDEQTLSAATYQTDLGNATTPARIMPIDGVSWPDTQSGTMGTVTVTFTAGRDDADNVSPSMKRAIKFLVAHWFRNHEPSTGIQTYTVPETMDLALAADDWGGYV